MNRSARRNTLRGPSYVTVLMLALTAYSIGDRAGATEVVAPNVFTNSEAPAITIGVFRGENLDVAFQWILPASDFAAVPTGSPLTAIGFRLNGSSLPAGAADFAQWNLQLSSANNPSLTLSETFANNIGPDVVTVRSGPLSIPANVFPFGQSPNEFFDIPFTTPFVYHGGEMVVTLRHTAHSGVQGMIEIDADSVFNNRGNSVAVAGFADTTGIVHFANFPVTRFTFVPEPSGLAPVAIAVALLSAYRRRP